MRARGIIGAMALVAVLSACSTGGSPMTTPSSARPPFQTASPLPSPGATPSGSTEAVPPKRWAAILGDLGSRGAPTDMVQLVSARSVTWPNGALGCPKPGSSYTQALVEGMQVVVSVEGKQYDYRFGTGDQPRLCERGIK